MNKRQFLSLISGAQRQVAERPMPPVGLSPYDGPWTQKEARHLLSRTVFGHRYSTMQQCTADGLDVSLAKLLTARENVDLPIYYNYDDDPNVPNGETWVNTPNASGANARRRNSHRIWMYKQMFEADTSIHEKMILFWHEHMPIAATNSAIFAYKYTDVLRRNALGNFRDLAEEVTITPAMLIYLNGRENTRRAPNENYARELMELFTVGRGPAVGTGDYTNYTEEDVFALARALTGWRFDARDTEDHGTSFFLRTVHDLDDKQLSHRFDNQVIRNADEEEYKQVIDILLQKEATAINLCRRLHIWFVGADITDEVEENIIKPLAQIMMANNYEMKPVLRALLGSEYFFNGGHEGCLVSSPIDYVFKLVKAFQYEVPEAVNRRYSTLSRLMRIVESLDQTLMEMPAVAGWKAYYQEPQFSKFWINSFSLIRREQLVDGLIQNVNDMGLSTSNLLGLLVDIGDDALDPAALIDALVSFVFPFVITTAQRDRLQEVLLGGSPEEVWTDTYAAYLSDPTDIDSRRTVEGRLVRLVVAICKMPEFHLL